MESYSARSRGGVTEFPETCSPSSASSPFTPSASSAGDLPHRLPQFELLNPNEMKTETFCSGILENLQSLNLQSEIARGATTTPINPWPLLNGPSPVDQSTRPPSVNYNSMGQCSSSNAHLPRNASQRYGFGVNQNTQGLLNSRGSLYGVIGQQHHGSPVFNYRANTPASSVRVGPPMNAPVASLFGARGSIFLLAKDQYGSQFLQEKIEQGNRCMIDVIFNEVIDNMAELMNHPSGNYLMQKLIVSCRDEQRMSIILKLTREPFELIKISTNQYGTRAVQKLICSIQTRHEAVLVLKSLRPGTLKLIKDPDGHHVIISLLSKFTLNDNKFIFDTIVQNCVDIAIHRSGCRVLQLCLTESSGEYQSAILAAISTDGLLLALDPFGNYVVQVILGLNDPFANANFVSQFEGNYVTLSKDKHGSNVVEKCIEVFGDHDRATIILELISAPNFEQVLQDQFANYVIQSALEHIKGPLNAALVEAIRPHSELKSSPHCKRIFSRPSLRNRS